MTIGAVLTLLAICVGLSLLVCVPVMLIVRRMRRGRPASVRGLGSKPVPAHQLPGLAAGVLIMFLGFSQAYLAPDTWFGQQMATYTGLIVFPVGLYLASVIGNIAVALWAARRPRD